MPGEIVTLGVGNYGVLCASQWCNGTTTYDTEHSVLYRHRGGRGAGGVSMSGDGESTAERPAARLLLLDHTEPSRIGAEMGLDGERKAKKAQQAQDEQEADDDAANFHLASYGNGGALRGGRQAQQQQSQSASLAMAFGLNDCPGAFDDPSEFWSTVDTMTATTVGRAGAGARKGRTTTRSARRGYDDDDEEDDEEDRSTRRHVDPLLRNDDDEDEEDEDEDGNFTGTLDAELAGSPPERQVPWWRYITAPVDEDLSKLMTSLSFSSSGGSVMGGMGGTGRCDGVAAMNSFGFGLRHISMGHASMETFTDNMRRQIEDCETPQGMQLFADVGSAFGGITCQLLEYMKDDFEDIRATCLHGAFSAAPPLPEFEDDDESERTVEQRRVQFAESRAQERLLNLALANAYLPQHAGLYAPYDVSLWAHNGVKAPNGQAFNQNDDVASAAVIASAADTLAYQSRNDDREKFRPLGATVDILRPDDALRVVAPFAALPLSVPAPKRSLYHRAGRKAEPEPPSFWTMLEQNEMLSGTPGLEDPRAPGGGDLQDKQDNWAALLWRLPREKIALPSHNVVCHVVAMRGVGKLKDDMYPRLEASLRYLTPLRTSRAVFDIFDEPLPLSGTFPVDRLWSGAPAPDQSSESGVQGSGSAAAATAKVDSETLTKCPFGAHYVNSYGLAGYFKEVCRLTEPVVKYKKHNHREVYGLEDDEWRETMEANAALRDAYDHEGFDGPADDDDNDSDY